MNVLTRNVLSLTVTVKILLQVKIPEFHIKTERPYELIFKTTHLMVLYFVGATLNHKHLLNQKS